MIARLMLALALALALVATTAAQTGPIYKICASSRYEIECRALQRGDSRINCETVTNKLDCALKLTKNEVDIGVFSEEEMLLLAHVQPEAHSVLASIRNTANRERFAFETVAVVPVAHRDALQGLRQGGYCHPGLDQTEQRWSPKVLRALENAAIDLNCADTAGKTYEEVEVAALSSTFRAACRPGRWSPDDAIDARLKREYPNLCTLCSGNGTSDCTGGYRYTMTDVAGAPRTNRHIQALECLTKYNGTVAYVAWTHVSEYFLQRHSEMIPNYALLCPNGTLAPLTAENLARNAAMCTWVQQPWSAVVTSPAKATTLLQEMRAWWPDGVDSSTPGSWQNIVFTNFIGGVNRVLVYEDTPPTAVSYVSSGRQVNNIDATATCMKVQRWCTVSEDERVKCHWVRNALFTLGIEPMISCQLRASNMICLKDIKEDNADFMAIDSNYGYLARQIFGLSPVMLLENDRALLSRVAALVRHNSDITRFENLRSKRACFPEFGGIAFVSFVVNGHNKSILSSSECNYAKAVAEFFNGTCAPGALDEHHRLYDSSFDASSLCSVCRPQYPTVGNWSSLTCPADWSNLYYGNNGTLSCLADQSADVIFVEVQNLTDHLARLNVQQSTFRALCSGNNSLGWPGASIPDDCLMSLVIDSEVLSRRNDPQLASLTSLLTYLDEYFGYTTSVIQSGLIDLHIYSPFNGTSDLLFKDSVIGLTPTTNSTFEPARNYFQLFRHLEGCTGGAKGLATNGGVFSFMSLVLVGLLTKLVF